MLDFSTPRIVHLYGKICTQFYDPVLVTEKMGFCSASSSKDKQQHTLVVDSNDPKSNPEQQNNIVKGEGLGSGGPWRKGGWSRGRFMGKLGNQG